jgi:hypothetical protein
MSDDQDIRQRAFEIWVEEGRPLGKDKEHWARAEREALGGSQGEEIRPEEPIGEIQHAKR